MIFDIAHRHMAPHCWATARCSCDPEDASDGFLAAVVLGIRDSYGERDVMQAAVNASFGPLIMDTAAIQAAFRMGLPDPEAEGNKPSQLTNYRSETSEIIARLALAEAHGIGFPSNPQQGKTNPNQPVLGFDGWGFLSLADSSTAFVLVQVKGTESSDRPPREASTLAAECQRVPASTNELCRALSILAPRLQGGDRDCVLRMLEQLGRGEIPLLAVAPVIVRGTIDAHFDDLSPVQSSCPNFSPAIARGVVVSVGAELGAVGLEAMTRARAA
jgi:hypothetical protein